MARLVVRKNAHGFPVGKTDRRRTIGVARIDGKLIMNLTIKK